MRASVTGVCLIAGLGVAACGNSDVSTGTPATAVVSTFTIETSGKATLRGAVAARLGHQDGAVIPLAIPFKGSISTIAADGSMSSRSVEGNTPESFTITGRAVSLTLQADNDVGSSEGAEFTVTIKQDGVVLRSEKTTAKYGVISLASR